MFGNDLRQVHLLDVWLWTSGPKSGVQSPKSGVQSPNSNVHSAKSKIQASTYLFNDRKVWLTFSKSTYVFFAFSNDYAPLKFGLWTKVGSPKSSVQNPKSKVRNQSVHVFLNFRKVWLSFSKYTYVFLACSNGYRQALREHSRVSYVFECLANMFVVNLCIPCVWQWLSPGAPRALTCFVLFQKFG